MRTFSASTAREWTTCVLAGSGPIMGMAQVRAAAFGVLGALCALVPALVMWGFTVDDALIPIRYASHVASGAGYRFNLGGPATDGVTPLPWVYMIAPFASADAMATLVRVKATGVFAWTLAAGVLAFRIARIRNGRSLLLPGLGFLVMALAFEIGAWSASGMETGVATALATLAVVCFEKPWLCACLAGLATALRPELVIWALSLSFGVSTVRAGLREVDGLRHAVLSAAIAGAPFVLCVLVRLAVFGRPEPLALMAKPSDLAHGLTYAIAAAVVLLTPLLAFAPIGLAKVRGSALAIVTAFVAHLLAIILVGGDWMPYARLVVPVAPSLVLAFTLTLARGGSWPPVARAVVATAIGAFLAVRAAPAGRHVFSDRADLVARAKPVLASSHVVAALDIGWVSAATPARIVDLAGLTDPTVAVLGGGHTSKRVDAGMLLDRNVDTVVVYSDMRVVEARLVRSELFASHYAPGEVLALGSAASYVVYRRR